MKRGRDEEIMQPEEITPEPRNECGFSRPFAQSSADSMAAEAKRSEAAEVLAGLRKTDSRTALDALLGLADAPAHRQLQLARPTGQASAVKTPGPARLPSRLLSEAHPRQLCLLAAAFKLCPEPNATQQAALATRIGLTGDAVAFWFRTRQVLESLMNRVPAAERTATVERVYAAHAAANDDNASVLSDATADAAEGHTARRSVTPVRASEPTEPGDDAAPGNVCESAGAAIAKAHASVAMSLGHAIASA